MGSYLARETFAIRPRLSILNVHPSRPEPRPIARPVTIADVLDRHPEWARRLRLVQVGTFSELEELRYQQRHRRSARQALRASIGPPRRNQSRSSGSSPSPPAVDGDPMTAAH